MSEENKAREQSRNGVPINFDDYRIDHPRKAPLDARLIRLVWGDGEEMYENYRDNYNRLVDSLEECVKHNAMSPEEAEQILEECREF